ncbi:HlyD family secretion protein [Saccharospirillum salsuginis]|uniref:Toxin secretion, membrane fusion protein n=1 Tax=Saccharospirillum salsuginis TaxID=418750 RepID=A0A918NCL1_9GAMM|nr:HlyD family efflux transporter periplasmic adaptor subunit [Saccharospirillum salsuginis]GGX57837.1 toxin secretion, membrane fusion protein [Saccharospirillum salsuginis]
MSNSLFREQARQAYQKRLNGQVRIATNPGHWWMAGLLLTMVIVIVVFFVLAEYTPKSTAAGTLVPEEGMVKVFPSSVGIVTDLHVAEGDVVKAGDALATVSFETNTSGNRQWGEAWLQQSEALIDSLVNDIQKLEASAELNRTQIDNRRDLLSLKEQQWVNEQSAIEEQIELARRRLERSEQLNRDGFTSDEAVMSAREALTDLEMRLTNVRLQLQSNRVEKDNLDAEWQQAEQEREQRLSQLQRELLAVRQQRVERQGQLVETIVAPRDGKVSTLLAEPGARVYPESPVLSLLPLWSMMQAEVYVPAGAIGFIRLGQDVELKFPSFPYQRYGTYAGEVYYISESTLAPGELGNNAAVGFKQPVYRLKIELEEQNITVRDGVFPMMAGMAVELNLIGEPIPFFEWLMKPIQDVSERFE